MNIDEAKRNYELALINQYTLEEVSQDVYVFSMRLCDSKVDSKNERLMVSALFDLKDLFLGKAGIIEVDDDTKNVRAKIISCDISRDGFDYVLTARAFIPDNEQTQSIIRTIESDVDIKVDVGIAVADSVCSICDYAMTSPLCNHIKGHNYRKDDGFELCYAKILSATAAFEFRVKLPKPKKYKAKVRRIKGKKDARQNSV